MPPSIMQAGGIWKKRDESQAGFELARFHEAHNLLQVVVASGYYSCEAHGLVPVVVFIRGQNDRALESLSIAKMPASGGAGC